MNSHHDIRRNLSAYCSGELSPAGREQVRVHLESCPECRKELADLETVLRLIRTTPEVEPPPWLTTRIMARVREQQAARPDWLKRLFFPLQIKLPLEAAALLVVCLTGWYLTRTVETELKQPFRSDTVESAPATQKPETVKPAAEQPAPGNQSVEPSLKLPHREQAPTPKQPALPQAHPSQAAPPVLQTPPPPPDASLQRKEEKSLPATAVPPAFLHPAPAATSAERLKDAATDGSGTPGKKTGRTEAESSAPAPAARGAVKQNLLPSPAVTLRLKTDNPAAASAAIRDAAERSGGYAVDDRAVPDRRITVSIPARRFIEFQQRLNRFGRIPAAPKVDTGAGMLAVTVSW